MKMRGTPGVLLGSMVGALLTAALIAVFYAGWRLADLPFVPFDVFDWTTRVLPGALIEFVIGAMVAIIRGLHLGPTSVVAKFIEQAMGIVGLFITGVVAGAVLSACYARCAADMLTCLVFSSDAPLPFPPCSSVPSLARQPSPRRW